MALSERESPIGKRVSLFVTCMVDTLYPGTGLSAVEILEYLGVEVDFPRRQTCCGQPAYNGGYRKEARQVAIQFLKAFKDAQVIVTPSGSCATMIRQEYPTLFAGDPKWELLALHVASITWELTEFIVDGLGIEDLKLRLPEPAAFAFHDSCHGLRMLGLGEAARKLVSSIENATIYELSDHDQCCGFGGLFAVKMADISGAMLQKKMDNINACKADTILCGDVSCLSHMNGGLERQASPKRVRHIADVLAEGLRGKQR